MGTQKLPTILFIVTIFLVGVGFLALFFYLFRTGTTEQVTSGYKMVLLEGVNQVAGFIAGIFTNTKKVIDSFSWSMFY